MTNKKTATILALCLYCGLSAATVNGQSPATAEQEEVGAVEAQAEPASVSSPNQAYYARNSRLAGVWRIEGHPDPASTIPSFVNLAMVTPSGKIVNVDPAIGAGVGDSRRVRRGVYDVTFYGFLELTPGEPLQYEVQGTLEVDFQAGTLSGPFTTLVHSLDGSTMLFSYQGTVDGTRLAVTGF